MAKEFFRGFTTIGHLGQELRRLRIASGLTQGELAERAGVSRRWINLAEQGHRGGEIGNLMKVVRSLDLELRFDRPPGRN
ncbi:MAG: helix-turn-helix domain-containing protein [bacterium]|nr:helix-turn-helix domain-containing protein [bacterium]